MNYDLTSVKELVRRLNVNVPHVPGAKPNANTPESIKKSHMDIKFKILRRSFTFLGTKVDYFFSTGVFGQFYQFDSKVISKIYSLLEENGKAVFTVKIKDEFTDEVLSVSEKRVTDLLKIYNHKIHKKYFTGISGEKDYFNVIELFKKEF